MTITQERLKEVLDYDSQTGIFTYRIFVKGSGRKIGEVAGCVTERYVVINVDKQRYYAHRLAWFYVNGVWPEFEIDHKDTIKINNSIDNLRDVTHVGNNQNKIKAKRNNKTGFLGVSYDKQRKRFVAQIKINGKQTTLGRFLTTEEAHQAYLCAKRIYHQGCTI